MNQHDIANKYVHGLHDALTDSQEKKDMAADILEFAEAYHKEKLNQLKIEGKLNRVELIKFYDYLSDSNVIRDEEKGKAFRWIDNFKNRKRTSKMKVVRFRMCING